MSIPYPTQPGKAYICYATDTLGYRITKQVLTACQCGSWPDNQLARSQGESMKGISQAGKRIRSNCLASATPRRAAVPQCWLEPNERIWSWDETPGCVMVQGAHNWKPFWLLRFQIFYFMLSPVPVCGKSALVYSKLVAVVILKFT